MLSPGEYYKHVPTDLQGNLAYRKWLIHKCREDAKFKVAVRAACRDDIIFYINSFVWQYNPDNIGHEVEPLILYDFQEHAIKGGDVEENGVLGHRWGILECIDDQEDVRWPKSRKMGASWIALCTMDWLAMFHRNKVIGCMSRDEDSVDKAGDPNSLFWKINFIHEHLPDWLKGTINRKRMIFEYKDTESIVVGEANTVSAFVSGRATALLIDEFGQFKNGAETFEMTSDVAMCRIFVFTHKEQAGMAYDLCFDAKYTQMREIKTHWSMHPDRKKGLYRYNDESNQIDIIDKLFQYPDDFKFIYESKPTGGPYPGLRSPWYDKECRRRSERDVAMNLDIDPRGASDKFFDAHRIQVLKAEFCRPPMWVGSLKYDKERGHPLELVHDPEGLIKLWVNPKSRNILPEMRCGAGADISAGTGTTPSCLAVFSADTGQKVCEYANALIFANQFAEFVVALLRMFPDRNGNLPLLGWEIQGGSAFGRRVRELGYTNVYIRRDEDAFGKPRDNKGHPGVNTAGSAVLPIMNNYRDAIYERRCVNHSEFSLKESLRFEHTKKGVEYVGPKKKNNKSLDPGSGATIHHGDIVTADAIAWKMVEELGLAQKAVVENLIPVGSLAWRRMILDNRRRDELVA